MDSAHLGQTKDHIKKSLLNFILTQTGEDQVIIDDIVLDYVADILNEMIDENTLEDEFELGDFMDMMQAYVPLFLNINSNAVKELLMDLTIWLTEFKKTEKKPKSIFDPAELATTLDLNIKSGHTKVTKKPSNQGSLKKEDDKEIKHILVSRYGYIDEDEDAREHRPIAPKSEPKKLIRYRDNQIVSTKGERFSEIKTKESDEMKQTYINLKPARQYRFH